MCHASAQSTGKFEDHPRHSAVLTRKYLPKIPVLGTCPSLDYAADYFIKTFAYSDPAASSLQASEASLDSYGKAIVHLRHDLLTLTGQSLGPALIAATILGYVDTVTLDSGHDRFRGSFLHRAGATAILCDEPSLAQLGMTIICADRSMFVDSCLTDTVSQYDQPRWLDAVFPERTDGLWELGDLQRTTMRLSIQLPRLIHEIRELIKSRQCPDFHSSMGLARSLMDETSHDAEDWMLHRVRLERTISPADRQLTPYSYVFRKPEEVSLAVRYWETRLLMVHLYRLVIFRESEDTAIETTFLAEEDRLATKTLMSWQYAYANRPGITMFMTLTFMCLWAVLKSRKTFKGRPISLLAERIRDHVQHTGAGGLMVGATFEAMDQTAAVFLGGPITGPVANLAEFIRASKTAQNGLPTKAKCYA
ncbi:hypothetical protein LTR86_005812 [Recurvomyces mirabilis]|nr:hypothetical protein LTR86_005812 [Recurvomyces mirabilis]